MKNKNYILIGVVVVVGIILVFIFTNNTTTIDTDQGTIEVSQDNNTVRINTNGGSAESGEDVSLPADFPSDIYVVDGDLIAAFQLDDNNGFILNIEAKGSVSDVKGEYMSNLEKDGWSITSSLDLQTGANITAEKNNRFTSVSIASEDGKTMVVINTYKDEE